MAESPSLSANFSNHSVLATQIGKSPNRRKHRENPQSSQTLGSETRMRGRCARDDSRAPTLPEAGAAEFLAEICAVQGDNAAHFMKARAHPFADPVP
jgi:hypothetical protein